MRGAGVAAVEIVISPGEMIGVVIGPVHAETVSERQRGVGALHLSGIVGSHLLRPQPVLVLVMSVAVIIKLNRR